MNPRLKSSKKWTSFPKEYLSQIEQAFRENFAKQLDKSKLIVEGRIYPEEVLLRVGVLEQGRLKQANIEASMDYSREKANAAEKIHHCIDAAASMLAEYFAADGDPDFPRNWTEYDFEKQKVYLQFTTVNSDLEAQADALLGESAEESLLHLEEEDAEETEDDGEESGPTMFGGGKSKNKKQTH